MSIRCKFQAFANDDKGNVTLEAVTAGSPENEKFFEATPAGSLQLSVVSEAASSQIEVGKEYYIDITPAE